MQHVHDNAMHQHDHVPRPGDEAMHQHDHLCVYSIPPTKHKLIMISSFYIRLKIVGLVGTNIVNDSSIVKIKVQSDQIIRELLL